MDKDIDFLYSEAMKLLLERDSKTKQFFTQEEYTKNIGIITLLGSARDNIYNKIYDKN